MDAATREPTRGKPLNSRELVEDLCVSSPPLRESRRAHLESFGTLIPHVFMAQVLARVCTCVQDQPLDGPMRAEVEGILASLEHGMATGDHETRNVISVSFVGDGELEPYFGRMRALMGPRLRAQIQGK